MGGLGIHELVADVLVNDGRLHQELWESSYRYPVKKHCFEAMLNNRDLGNGPAKEGILSEDLDPEGKVQALPSCIAFFPGVKKGEKLQPTRDLATAPGCFMLCHPRLDQCWKDLEYVRTLEAGTGSYKLYNVASSKEEEEQINCALAATPMFLASPIAPVNNKRESSELQLLLPNEDSMCDYEIQLTGVSESVAEEAVLKGSMPHAALTEQESSAAQLGA